MNKSQLKSLWGKYADTDKLVEDISRLLTEYSHRNTEYGICTMLHNYFVNKEPLIKLIQKSKYYAGDLRIVKHKEFVRENSAMDIRNFCGSFVKNINAEKELLQKKDSSGKTIEDYLKTGIKHCDVKKLHDVEFLKVHEIDTREFTNKGYTKESANKLAKLENGLYCFSSINNVMLTDTQAERLTPYIKATKGTKTSRVFNRFCESLDVHKLKKYNQLYAKYSDMVSGLMRSLDYIISVNPYDYLTMSFGVNWASCHTIDKTNRRNMANHYSGQYCGGTLSYMLDKSSIITFVVDKDADAQSSGKIYRNMFHFKEDTLIQGRVYPQGNDGNTDLYETFRSFMHEELAEILGAKNHWIVRKGTDSCGRHTISHGVHYRDYLSFNSCNISYLDEIASGPRNMDIGAVGICPCCGEEVAMSSSISHSDCNL